MYRIRVLRAVQYLLLLQQWPTSGITLLLQNMRRGTFLSFKIDSPLSDVSMRALIQVENIWSIYCEL